VAAPQGSSPDVFLERLLVDLSREVLLILLLSLDESFFEEVGICVGLSAGASYTCSRYILSELANLIARVEASGSPSLTSAATFQTQLRSLPTFGDSFMSGVTGLLLAID
jgi:hypothetical protein